MNISVLILAKNEDEVIEDCLKKLKFANEIIVLDKNSKDDTVKIAKKYTNNIISSNLEDYDENRNLLAKKAKEEWLLYLDPDERLSEDNIKEIFSVAKEYSIYYFPRKNYVLGKWLKHGGWWPDYVPRLIKSKDFVKWEGKVHEAPIVRGSAYYFKNPITHLTARSLKKMLAKSIKWGKIEAQLYYSSNAPKITILKVVKAIIKEFILRYFVKKGFLDGRVGLIEAIYQSYHQAIVLVYLWEIQTNAKEKFNSINK